MKKKKLEFYVSHHAYTRAWSRSLFRSLLSINNADQLREVFQKAFQETDHFIIGNTPGSYKCSDRNLVYVFAAKEDRMILITAYPLKNRISA